MYIHQITPYSVVNGPFERTVIHFQGCTLSCPGCFNTSTHPMKDGMSLSVKDLLVQIPSGQEHITISGGEPFLQAKELLELVQVLRTKGFGIVLFSGFYLNEIKKIPEAEKVLEFIDVLIDGRFEEENVAQNGIRGSSNQTLHFLTDKYTPEQMTNRQFEIQFNKDGGIIMTGFPDPIWEEALGMEK